MSQELEICVEQRSHVYLPIVLVTVFIRISAQPRISAHLE